MLFALSSPLYKECLAHLSLASFSLTFHPLGLSQVISSRLAPPLTPIVSSFGLALPPRTSKNVSPAGPWQGCHTPISGPRPGSVLGYGRSSPHHSHTHLEELLPITVRSSQPIMGCSASLSSSSLFKVFAEHLLWTQLHHKVPVLK